MSMAIASRNYLYAIAVALALMSFFVCVCGFLSIVPIGIRGQVDFRHLYTAGYMLRTGHGHDLYDYAASEKFQNILVSPAIGALPFNHLAYESLLFAPLSYLNYKTAYFAFLLLNLTIAVVVFQTLRPYLDSLAQTSPQLPLALWVCFFPLTMALTEGQDSILLLALMIFATCALDRGRDLRAGVLVGLTLFKFQYGLPIALLFLVWKRWRFLIGFAATGAITLAVSISITGRAAFIFYLHSLTEMSSRFSPNYAVRYGIHPAAMPNLRGLIQQITLGSAQASLVLTVILSTAVLIVAATKRASLPLALLAAILVSYHHLITDTTMLFLPAVLALTMSITARKKKSSLVSAMAGLLLFSPAILLLAGPRFYLLPIPMVVLLALWDGHYPTATIAKPKIDSAHPADIPQAAHVRYS
jgi:Glycosyltransferase family 87